MFDRNKHQRKLWQNPEYRKRMITAHKKSFKEGRTSWLKGKHIKINNALDKWRKNGGQPWNKNKKCPQLAGKNQWQWKGGKRKNTKGYILLLRTNHPFADKHGYILEHRLIMEKYLERYLTREEVVHHINGIITDNRIENLKLFKNGGEHRKFPHKKLVKINDF